MVAVESIDLGSGNSFIGWSLKKLGEGASLNPPDGKRRVPFNFSGSIKTLPEFHRALSKTLLLSTFRELPTAAEGLKMLKSEKAEIPLHQFGKPVFHDKTFRFGDFAVYVEDALFRSKEGSYESFESLTVTKKKSERAMKALRANEPPFFLIRVSVHTLKRLRLAVEMLLLANGIEQLPVTIQGGGDDDDGYSTRPASRMVSRAVSEAEDSDSDSDSESEAECEEVSGESESEASDNSGSGGSDSDGDSDTESDSGSEAEEDKKKKKKERRRSGEKEAEEEGEGEEKRKEAESLGKHDKKKKVEAAESPPVSERLRKRRALAEDEDKDKTKKSKKSNKKDKDKTYMT